MCYLCETGGPRLISFAIYVSPVVQGIFCVLFTRVRWSAAYFVCYLHESGGPVCILCDMYVSPPWSKAYFVCYLRESCGPGLILYAIYLSPVVQGLFCVLFT